jgi:hypothetical protein
LTRNLGAALRKSSLRRRARAAPFGLAAASPAWGLRRGAAVLEYQRVQSRTKSICGQELALAQTNEQSCQRFLADVHMPSLPEHRGRPDLTSVVGPKFEPLIGYRHRRFDADATERIAIGSGS